MKTPHHDTSRAEAEKRKLAIMRQADSAATKTNIYRRETTR